MYWSNGFFLIIFFNSIYMSSCSSSFREEMSNAALFFKEINKLEKRSNDGDEGNPGKTLVDEENAEKTINSLLAWLQERYVDSNRKAREDPARGYLPALPGGSLSTTQRPRPFAPTESPASIPPRGQDGPYSPSGPPSGPPSPAPYPQTPPQDVQLPPREYPRPTGTGPTQAEGQPGVYNPPGPSQPTGNAIDGDDPNAHPPHIHEIQVQCGKQSMTIDIEFNRVFDGVIYSKGYHLSPECKYVGPNGGRTRYSFTVSLDSCGTQFVDMFDRGGEAYLENVLVLQNEPGIQEVWDTIRSVRCLWEGNIKKPLSVGLSVGTLTQEVVTFSGDTATARLDIQVGKGPFAPSASGLVRIGETMTLVVTVEGDPGFQVLVRDCKASDGNPSSGNSLDLTDSNGCVLRNKLIGSFQTTTDPSRNSIVAYAFFQAFKFPDVMDLTIECNVELCKSQCSPCSDPNQRIDPGRRRKKRSEANITEETFHANWTRDPDDPITLVAKRLRVFLPEEIEPRFPGENSDLNESTFESSIGHLHPDDTVCLSRNVLSLTLASLLALALSSTVAATLFWINNRKIKKTG